MAKSALGKGLSALMGVPAAARVAVPEPGETVRQVARGEIVPSPLQPRKSFRPEELAELADSIREKGIIQPLIVRRVQGKYELIAGERRWRAAAACGLAELPVIVREASDGDVLELALIENLQRADLNPIEEAEAYARLLHDFALTQEQVAQRVGRGRAAVANAVRLLGLTEPIRAWLGSGELSVGHAKVLLKLPGAAEQNLAADRIRREGLTVRATERLVDSLLHRAEAEPRRKSAAPGRGAGGSIELADLEKRLQRHLGTRVKISGQPHAGQIEIHFFSAADLDRLLGLLQLPE